MSSNNYVYNLEESSNMVTRKVELKLNWSLFSWLVLLPAHSSRALWSAYFCFCPNLVCYGPFLLFFSRNSTTNELRQNGLGSPRAPSLALTALGSPLSRSGTLWLVLGQLTYGEAAGEAQPGGCRKAP